jgi:hypothetical protein
VLGEAEVVRRGDAGLLGGREQARDHRAEAERHVPESVDRGLEEALIGPGEGLLVPRRRIEDGAAFFVLDGFAHTMEVNGLSIIRPWQSLAKWHS